VFSLALVLILRINNRIQKHILHLHKIHVQEKNKRGCEQAKVSICKKSRRDDNCDTGVIARFHAIFNLEHIRLLAINQVENTSGLYYAQLTKFPAKTPLVEHFFFFFH
jgi:hypothetical protein